MRDLGFIRIFLVLLFTKFMVGTGIDVRMITYYDSLCH